MSWENAWQHGRTGWDAGLAAPSLSHLLETGELPTRGRALVPGAGSGYDAIALARHGLSVTAMDLAPTAGERLRALRDEAGLDAAQLEVVVGDFFEYKPDAPFDVIWDYTFLCAIDPEVRGAWARQMSALLAPDGELVTLIFPIVRITQDRLGPPFQLTHEQVEVLLTPHSFHAAHLAPVPHALSHKSRRGKEWLGRWRRR